MNPGLQRALRAVFRTLQRIAPDATGQLVFRLFCIVPRGKPPGERERALLGEASGRLEQGERSNVPFERGHVAVWHFAATSAAATASGSLPVDAPVTEPVDASIDAPVDSPVTAPVTAPGDASSTVPGTSPRRVVLVHGFASRADHMAAFIDPLLAAGFEVVLIDLPAHGASSGRRIQLLRAVRALQAVRARTGPWYALVGHSFGGTIATAAIAGTLPGEPPIPVERLALITAPENLRQLFEGFGRAVGLETRALAAMNAMVERIADISVDAFRGGEQLAPLDTRVLVVHDAGDREVPVSEADAFARAGNHVRQMRTEGLGHRRILYAATVIAAVTDHLLG